MSNTPAPLPPLDRSPEFYRWWSSEIMNKRPFHDSLNLAWMAWLASQQVYDDAVIPQMEARRPSSTGDAGAVSPGVPDRLREAVIAACAAFHDTAHIGQPGSAWIDNLRDKINAMGAALASLPSPAPAPVDCPCCHGEVIRVCDDCGHELGDGSATAPPPLRAPEGEK